MEEYFDSYPDPETQELVNRFEKMLRNDKHFFFDIDEFEEIIDYYLFKNDLKNAGVSIDYSLIQHPASTSLLLKKAQLFVYSNKNEKALKILKEMDHLGYSDYDLHLIKGNLYSQLEKYEKAIEEYSKAIHGSDDLDEIYSNIAFEYENLGKYDRAIEYLLMALDCNPENDSA